MNKVIARIEIVLEDTDPPIWRKIEVGATTMLKMLHRIIQAVMGWENAHAFQFEIGGYKAGGGHVRLTDLAKAGFTHFTYFYGNDDNWGHAIHIEAILPADPGVTYPHFIAGAGRCPPEHVSDVSHFYSFLDALADANHPRHAECLKLHNGPFDEQNIDENKIRERLAKIAHRTQQKTT